MNADTDTTPALGKSDARLVTLRAKWEVLDASISAHVDANTPGSAAVVRSYYSQQAKIAAEMAGIEPESIVGINAKLGVLRMVISAMNPPEGIEASGYEHLGQATCANAEALAKGGRRPAA